MAFEVISNLVHYQTVIRQHTEISKNSSQFFLICLFTQKHEYVEIQFLKLF